MKLRNKMVLHLGSTAFLVMTAVLLLAMLYTICTLNMINEEGHAYALSDLRLRAANSMNRFRDAVYSCFTRCRFFLQNDMTREQTIRQIDTLFGYFTEAESVFFGRYSIKDSKICFQDLYGLHKSPRGIEKKDDFTGFRESEKTISFLSQPVSGFAATFILLTGTQEMWIVSRSRESSGQGRFAAFRLNMSHLIGMSLTSHAGYVIMQGDTVLDESYSRLDNRITPELQQKLRDFCMNLKYGKDGMIRTQSFSNAAGRISWFATGILIDPAMNGSGFRVVRIYDYDSLKPVLTKLIDHQVSNMFFYIALFLAVGFLLMIVPLFLISRQFSNPFSRVAVFAGKLANGDFTAETGVSRSGISEMDLMVKNLEYMRDQLNSMVGKLKRSHSRELAARKEAENSNRIKSDFLDTLALEYKEPLNVLTGFRQLLEKDLQTRESIPSSNILPVLKAVRSNIDSLAGMGETLHELADFGRQKDYVLNPVTCEVFQLFRDLNEPFIRQAHEKNIDLEFHYGSDLPDRIRVDKDMFMRMGSLLLSALFSGTPAHGRIMLSAARENNSLVMLCKGEGRNPVPLEYLLYSTSGRPLRSFDCACDIISLTIAKYFAAALNAEFEISCPDDKSYLVRIAFPFHELASSLAGDPFAIRNHELSRVHAAQEPTSARRGKTASRTIRVLLAEDDESQSLLLQMMLQDGSCQVTLCSDMVTLRAHLTKEMPDVLILDLHMRGLDRFPFLSEAARLANGRKPCIILLAPFLDDGEKNRLISAGADRCLLKPVDMEELTEAVHSSLFT